MDSLDAACQLHTRAVLDTMHDCSDSSCHIRLLSTLGIRVDIGVPLVSFVSS